VKLLILILPALCGVLLLCAGCSTVQPAPEQHPVAAIPAAPKPEQPKRDYPMSWFVRGWLAGESSPPDYSEPGDNGSWAWLALGVPLEFAGFFLARPK
jgi:hypothetical protein